MQSANSRGAARGKRSTTSDSPARSARSGVPALCGTAPSSAGARMFPRGWVNPQVGEDPPHLGAQAGDGQRLAGQPQLGAGPS